MQVIIPTGTRRHAESNTAEDDSRYDWQFAMNELNSNQIKLNQTLEEEAQREKQVMDNKIKAMEER